MQLPRLIGDFSLFTGSTDFFERCNFDIFLSEEITLLQLPPSFLSTSSTSEGKETQTLLCLFTLLEASEHLTRHASRQSASGAERVPPLSSPPSLPSPSERGGKENVLLLTRRATSPLPPTTHTQRSVVMTAVNDDDDDDADKENWAALAETFDFSEDDSDGEDTSMVSAAAQLKSSRDGRDASNGTITSIHAASGLKCASSSRLLPVRRLEDVVCGGEGDIHTKACRRDRIFNGDDDGDDDSENLAVLRHRFATVFRSKEPCITRRAAAPWMSSSRLGNRDVGPGGVFADADAPAHGMGRP